MQGEVHQTYAMISNIWNSQIRKFAAKTLFITFNIFFFIFFIRFFVIDFGVISGPSMKPSFQDGKYIAVLKTPLFFRLPRRFEVVQLIDPRKKDTLLIKRIVGLPGETVVFRRNNVCISGPKGAPETCLKENYLSEGMTTNSRSPTFSTHEVPEGMYYLLGDDRLISSDSRIFGPVPRNFIIGTAIPL